MTLKVVSTLSAMAALAAVLTVLSPPPVSAQTAASQPAPSLVSLARQAEADGDNRAAIALYRQAHDAFPGASEPLTGWGLLAARLGAVDQAADLLTAALEIDPGHPAATAGLAEVLVDLDRPAEALALFNEILHQDPTDLAALDGRAFVLSQVAGFVESAEAPHLTDSAFVEASGPLAAIASPRNAVETALPARTAADGTAAVWR